MKRIAVLLIVAGVAGCGADSPPFTPSANIGLSLGSDGVSTNTSIGASNGTVSVGVGF